VETAKGAEVIDPRSLGATIKEEREKRGWERSKLSRMAGVTASGIERIERTGRTTIETFLFICEALDVRPSVLFFRAQKKDKAEH
jgi:transcriptional regulator with XRE-family HTH domain